MERGIGKKDPRIDAYIAKPRPFARPILRKLRTLVHRADPDIQETLKWGMPTFVQEGIVCDMAAFKQHARAASSFKALSPSHCNEYVEWITGDKREETRGKRVATALDWLARGRNMNWRYEKRA